MKKCHDLSGGFFDGNVYEAPIYLQNVVGLDESCFWYLFVDLSCHLTIVISECRHIQWLESLYPSQDNYYIIVVFIRQIIQLVATVHK